MELIEINNEQFRQLLGSFIDFLKEKSYKKEVLDNYRRTLAKIDLYMQENGLTKYDPEVGDSYYGWYVRKHPIGKNRTAALLCAIRRLNDFYLGIEYKVQHSNHKILELSDDYEAAIMAFMKYCHEKGNKENTIFSKSQKVRSFLWFCTELGCQVIGSLTPSCIAKSCLKFKNKDGWAVVRSFLKYLFINSLVNVDYSTIVPYYKRGFKLPVSYSELEIQQVEAAIDRNAAIGKRDYAMILLATRAGMRSGDIVLLCTENIDFCNKTISFVQQKTNEWQQLPLLPEVEQALKDYLSNARPDVNGSRIFLRCNAPFQPVTTSVLRFETSKYFRIAGIDIENKKHGPHTFRSSMATSMANDGIPYEAIRKVLGHTDPNAVKHYAKLDVEKLRICAVKVPEPAGVFKDFLEGDRI